MGASSTDGKGDKRPERRRGERRGQATPAAQQARGTTPADGATPQSVEPAPDKKAVAEVAPGDKVGPVTLPMPIAVIKRTIERTTGEGGLDRAAAMAYYAIQALFPAILGVVLISLLLASTESISSAVDSAQEAGLSKDLADALREILTGAVERADKGAVLATIVAGVLAIASASGLLAAAGRAMEPDVQQRKQRNIITGKIYFWTWTLILIVLAVISLASLTLGGDLADDIATELGRPNGAPAVWPILRPILVLGGLVATMLLLFRIAPDPVHPVPVRRQLPGAALSGIGLVLGTLAFSFYITNLASIGATYGTFATPIVLLLWMYYSSVIILLGAEFNHELAERSGKFRQPLRLAGANDAQRAGHPAGALPDPEDD